MKHNLNLSTRFHPALALAILVGGLAGVKGADAAVGLISDKSSGQPVGTTVTFSVTAKNLDLHKYRLSIGSSSSPTRVIYDYSDKRAFQWTPTDDGEYVVKLSARNKRKGTLQEVQQFFSVASRVTADPIVTATQNPLVALYSARPCPVGRQMRVVFFPEATPDHRNATSFKPCDAQHSMNFYLAGMTPNTTYSVINETQSMAGTRRRYGPILAFDTGANIPAQFTNGSVAVTYDPAFQPTASFSDQFILISLLSDLGFQMPFAVDLTGTPVWYYDREPVSNRVSVLRPVAGGSMFMNVAATGVFREVDLAGNVLRETNIDRLSEQYLALQAAAGNTAAMPLTSVHHDAIRLPNGDTALLTSEERLVNDVQGTGSVDIIGDTILVLDQDWQVVWFWDSFEHMDVTRAALLNEKCGNVAPWTGGCPPVTLVPGTTPATLANDWLHSNSLHFTSDHNFVVSMRHQDWVIKIHYDTGTGDGHVIWRLGNGGDFSMSGGSWFSHQHNANFYDTAKLVLYDNGNTRCLGAVPGTCNSRGQAYELDETAMTAIPLLNADLGVYAPAVGSAQRLSNGNFYFHSGILQTTPTPTAASQMREFDSAGSQIEYTGNLNAASYRSFRMPTLYYGSNSGSD